MTKTEVIADLSRQACMTFEVDPGELTAQTRLRGPVLARQWVWLQLRDAHGWSLAEIGRAMGRDHTTIMSGVRAARGREAAGREQAGALRESLEAWEMRMGWQLEAAT